MNWTTKLGILIVCLVLITFVTVIYLNNISLRNVGGHINIEKFLSIPYKIYNGKDTISLNITSESKINLNLTKENIDLIVTEGNEMNPTSSIPKTFIYLVQAPHCLPELLQGNDYFGNSDICNCDVIVYSYKTNCTMNSLRHVQYIFDPSESTWTTGRNLLYRAAKDRGINYFYYIFLDEDIYLTYDADFGSLAKNQSISPLRAFEQFLLDYEPAVGMGNYYFHHTAREIMNFIKNSCQNNAYSNHSSFTSPLYLSMGYFDACFNAYHRDALDDLLPYDTVRDALDWWTSHSIVVMKIELKFRGHAVMYTPVCVNNPLHRSYPQNIGTVFDDLMTYSHQLVAELPAQYQNVDWIQKSFLVDKRYIETTRTLCYLFPAHHPIKIYSHFDLDWTV